MIVAEWVNRRKIRITAHELDDLSYGQALAIGLYQIISVLWPGFSRSGLLFPGDVKRGQLQGFCGFFLPHSHSYYVCGFRI